MAQFTTLMNTYLAGTICCLARFRYQLSMFMLPLGVQNVFAQGVRSSQASDLLIPILLVFMLIIIILMVMVVSQKMIVLSAETVKIAPHQAKWISLLPSMEEWLGSKTNNPYIGDNKVIKLKKGFNINIRGRAVKKVDTNVRPATYAINPKDFHGLAPIPKLLVAEKQEVRAGDPLFYDKSRPEVMFVAPVSGEIVEIRRGEKRSLEHIVILADGKNLYKEFPPVDPKSLSSDDIKRQMLESGCFALIRQRPFNVVADPHVTPKAIFISGFDTSPLAPNYNFTLKGLVKEFQAGIDALSKLTKGKVHLSLPARQTPCDTFAEVKNLAKHWFDGPHPAGLVGIQIHHIDPINKGDIVWTVNPQHVVFIGRLFLEGRYNTEQVIAVAGPEVKEPRYFKTYQGAHIEPFVKDNLLNTHVRYISGNVLTGKQIDIKGFLGFFDQLLTVIQEGDQYEMLGWLIPSYPRPSLSPTLPWSTLNPNEEFSVTTNTHGEHRALVVTGQYEDVLPMDIYPQHLIKAIIANDFDKMEGLGIYEVVEEDLALCEFVCTSKTDVQRILREGIDYVRSQS